MLKITRKTIIKDSVNESKICFENVYYGHESFSAIWLRHSADTLKLMCIEKELPTLSTEQLDRIKYLIDSWMDIARKREGKKSDRVANDREGSK